MSKPWWLRKQLHVRSAEVQFECLGREVGRIELDLARLMAANGVATTQERQRARHEREQWETIASQLAEDG